MMNKEDLLAVEEDFLRGLISAAEDQKTEVVQIEIIRGGKKYFEFGIHPLTEADYLKARDDATKFKKARNMGGVVVPEKTNSSKYRSLLIYRATVLEDRKKLWDNKEAWKTLNVINGPDLIDKVLKAGEKDAVIEKLDELSGYADEDEVIEADEFAKN